MRATIYGLYDEAGDIRYVGKTTHSLSKRFAEHIGSARRNARRATRDRWIQEMLRNDAIPTIAVIETVDGDGNVEEIKWIAFHRRNGAALTNTTDGGEGTPGLKFTEEHRAKISKALTGITRSEATRAKIREARARQITPAHRTPHTEETRRRIREILADPQIRKRIGDANRGRARNAKQLETLSVRNSDRWANPSERQQFGTAVRSRWQDPEWRANQIKKRKAFWAKPSNRRAQAKRVREFHARSSATD